MITLLLSHKQIVRKFCFVYFFIHLLETGCILMLRSLHIALRPLRNPELEASPSTKALIIMDRRSEDLVSSPSPNFTV